MSDSDENEMPKKPEKKLFLEELRYASERLENANNAIDSKSAVFLSLALLTLSVIIASLIDLFSTPISKSLTTNSLYQSASFFLFSLIIFCIIIGLFYLLRIIKPKIFNDPFTYHPNHVLKRLDLNYEELEECMIIEYRQSNAHSKCMIDKKADLLDTGIKILQFGFLFAFIGILVMIYIKIMSGIYG